MKAIEINPRFVEILARPEQTLEEHLIQINKLAFDHLNTLKLNFDDHTKDLIKISLVIIVFTHDLGKATEFFQKALKKDRVDNFDPKLKNHSLFSALFTISTFKILELYLNKDFADSQINSIEGKAFFDFFGYLSQLIVRCHHGNLKDLSTIYQDFSEEVIENHKIRFNHCNLDFIEYIYTHRIIPCLNRFNNIFNFSEGKIEELSILIFIKIKELALRILNDKKYRKGNLYRTLIRADCELEGASFGLSQKIFFLGKLMNSILLETDKINSAMGNLFPEVESITTKTFQKRLHKHLIRNFFFFPEEIFPAQLQDLNQRRRFVLSKLITYPIKNGSDYGTLNLFTVPTGYGKTLSSLYYASRMKSPRSTLSFENSFPISPRIIYSLPFLSIIDQTEHVLNEFISKQKMIPHSLFLVHHHLTQPEYYTKGNGNGEIDESIADLLIQSWNSQYILTTFVQLLNSIFKSSKSSSLKFTKIINSTWIIDEFQAIPLKYWKLLNVIFDIMKNNFYTNIVVMSATLPKIVGAPLKKHTLENNQNEMCHLINEVDYKRLVANTDRISLEFQGNIEFAEFKDKIKLLIQNNKEKNILLILNTRRSAQELYIELCKFEKELQTNGVTNKKRTNILFLAATQTPYKKQKVIDQVKEILQETQNKKGVDSHANCVLVSTQCIEAGVDVDFDLVIRDFAPIDSIIQAAGRCNRNAGKKGDARGIVKIFRIWNNDNRLTKYYANYIYDQHLLTISSRLLKNYGGYPITFKESQIHLLVSKYYEMIEEFFKDGRMREEIAKYEEYIIRFQYHSLSKNFELITFSKPQSFYIEENEQASKILHEYLELRKQIHQARVKTTFPIELYNRLLRVKKEIQSYIITAYLNTQEMKMLRSIQKIGDLIIINKAQLSLYYSDDIGFNINTMEEDNQT
ncbi:MAG: CRISPR-associated helicase Cas3' [Promethearchaeota archaeon]